LATSRRFLCSALVAVAAVGCGANIDESGTIRYDVDGHRQLALPGKHGAPQLVLLHGRGSNPEAFLRDGVMQQELRRLGPRAPSVVLPSCSDHC
jgi:hypothetical protein